MQICINSHGDVAFNARYTKYIIENKNLYAELKSTQKMS